MADETIGKTSLKKNDRTQPNFSEVGISGTRIFGGYLAEEANPALQGLQGLQTFKQMTYDPTVAATLRAIRMPIQSTKWYSEPASDDPNDVYLADFLHHVIWEFGSMSMDELVRMGVGEPLVYGFQPLEIVYDRIVQGDYAGLIGWDKLAYRAPISRLRWNIEEIDSPGGARIRELVSMTQQAAPSYRTVDIPRDKLLLFTNEKLGELFDGISLCRYMYQPWFYKRNLLTIQSIGLERAYMGIIDMELPEDYTKPEFDVAQGIVENLRTGENAGSVHTAAMKLNVLSNKLEGAAMQSAIEFHDTQICQQILAQFLKLGQSQGGAYALSEDQSDLFLMVLNSFANQFAQVVNLWPGIPQLVNINFANVDPSSMPRLAHGEVGQRNLDQLGRVYAALGQWGFLTPDAGTEGRLREQLELPEQDKSITPEALRALSQTLTPEMPSGIQRPSRQVTVAGLPTPVTPVGGTPDPAKAAEFAEMQARMPWRRGNAKDPIDRIRMAIGEELLDFMETSNRPQGAPEKPSITVAKRRKPYVLRMAETPGQFHREQKARILHLPRTSAEPRTLVMAAPAKAPKKAGKKIILRHAPIAKKHEAAMRAVIEDIKSRAS